ncbi:hypothetical protein CEY15_11350 [Dietzia natronolimnaea]|uniref:CHRD domain-containing protein n=1 Tax=Dietzia natronolimnaea TaxID=161920 RepID=A0A2A2WP00_9ACTN|nr:CHRD domain-containing protein [Dietzia natronolimnaea]PAY22946.1 hypothetical protein CEY15_11350 [Dietzia natronolimnaea]
MPSTTTNRTGMMGVCALAGAAALVVSAAPAQANTEVDRPDYFTSAFSVMAVPGEVIDSDGEVAPGEEGATGDFMFWVNSDTDVICYEITLDGVTGEYDSPAITATHIHEARAGEPGPPRIAFPDPQPVGDGPRTSEGCMQGPFTTGVEDDDGTDRGAGFTLDRIEADPAGFTADTHTEEYTAGTVRGQLMQVPLDGVETGGGGADGAPVSGAAAGAGAAAIALGGLALFLLRRQRSAV